MTEERTECLLVIGSKNGSNPNRLAEIRLRSYLIDDTSEIRPEWLVGTDRIGVTAGAIP